MSIKSLQSCLTLCDPMDCSLPDFSVHGILPGKNTGVGCHVFLQGMFLPQGSGIEPMSPAAPALQADSVPLSHQGSSKEVIDGYLYARKNITMLLIPSPTRGTRPLLYGQLLGLGELVC